jgi:hypothetical protein
MEKISATHVVMIIPGNAMAPMLNMSVGRTMVKAEATEAITTD